MATQQFTTDRRRNILKIEGTLFFRDLCVKNDLK